MSNQIEHKITAFLNATAFGVVGASTDREKYGNKVLRVYIQNNKPVYAVNPREDLIEGIVSVPSIKSLPREVKSISIITPPSITEKIVHEAVEHGIENIWMQPGAESESAIRYAESHGINVIANGPCILVVLHYHE